MKLVIKNWHIILQKNNYALKNLLLIQVANKRKKGYNIIYSNQT